MILINIHFFVARLLEYKNLHLDIVVVCFLEKRALLAFLTSCVVLFSVGS